MYNLHRRRESNSRSAFPLLFVTAYTAHMKPSVIARSYEDVENSCAPWFAQLLDLNESPAIFGFFNLIDFSFGYLRAGRRCHV